MWQTGIPTRAFHCAAAIDRSIYVFGGHLYHKEKRGLHKFNDIWCLDTVCADMPNSFQLFYCAYMRNACLYVYIDRHTQDTWEWSPLHVPPGPPRPCPRDFASMVALPGRRLLMFGGLDPAERRLDDLWVFDIASCVFQQQQQQPSDQFKQQCTVALLRTVCRWPEVPKKACRMTPPFKDSTPVCILRSTWSEVRLSGPARPKPRYGQALLRLDQRVLLFGGEAAGGISGDLWALRGVVTVDSDVPPSWLPLELPGSQPAPRKGHAAACTPKDMCLQAHISEWYFPDTTTWLCVVIRKLDASPQ